MKIVHICLACFYVENMGYQENILPRLHAQMGHDVTVLTSDYQFNEKGERETKQQRAYTTADGVAVRVLDRKDKGFGARFGAFPELAKKLEQIQPDILFVHGGQFLSLREVTNYCAQHPAVRLYIDQHGDYYNMPVNTWKQKLVQKAVYGHGMRRAAKHCRVFWGVTPWRCEYLQKVYRLPQEKISLLPMGGLEMEIPAAQRQQMRRDVRGRLGLSEDDFVIISGGKIDAAKKIHCLMQAVAELKRDDVKLIVFGVPTDDVQQTFYRLASNSRIRAIGWLASADVSQYLFAADLAVFAGTHSVLWEQVCAAGLPALFRDWQGMHHVDVGGNCAFVHDGSVEELKQRLTALVDSPEEYEKMKLAAQQQAAPAFSYREIAKRAIEL